jgi:hypothetical protein
LTLPALQTVGRGAKRLDVLIRPVGCPKVSKGLAVSAVIPAGVNSRISFRPANEKADHFCRRGLHGDERFASYAADVRSARATSSREVMKGENPSALADAVQFGSPTLAAAARLNREVDRLFLHRPMSHLNPVLKAVGVRSFV